MAHKHEWWWNEDEDIAADMPFVCECGEVMDGVEALNRLNATEQLSADVADMAVRMLHEAGWIGPTVQAFMDYAEMLRDE